ncbi:hypothetical protein ACIQ7D_17870 [Streptomyces sp. NPDC096310]|uniref:hypothetical protein n=1 Tax=Streptomyces sp. NPDC096310 TaxID=3366082 RepID=UPI003815E3BB
MVTLLARFFARQATDTQENHQMTTEAMTPTPADDVLMRFLTVGGATVELRNDTTVKECSATIATCLGCGAVQTAEWATEIRLYSSRSYVIQDRTKGERNARDKANEHATACRAMPRPPSA